MAVTARIWAPALIFLLSLIHTDCHVTRFGKMADTLFFPPLSVNEKMGHNVQVIEGKAEDEVDELLHRFARAATTPSPAAGGKAAELNDSHTTLIVHWAGENSDVIIALAKNGPANGTSVFVSRDYGNSFTDISFKLKVGDNGPLAEIAHYYNTPAHNSHYVFTDIKSNCTFTTTDYAQTFNTHCSLPFIPRTVSINSHNPHLVLAMDEESREKELFVSENFGFTWRKIHDNVKSFYWGVAAHDSTRTIYVEAERSSNYGNIVYKSNDLFQYSWRKETVITGVKDFEVRGRYLFATKQVRLLGASHVHIQLWVSLDRGRFQMAQFPTPENKEYYVADASEDQVMVCVNHNKTTTNLYISEVKGLSFSLSLERVVYYSPKGANNDTWLRYYSNETFADIHRVDGLRGIYIASQLIGNTFSIESQRSLITFDKGGEWQLINAPAQGDRDENCSSAKVTPWSYRQVSNCSLHLTQQLHRYYPASRASPILSRKSAPGIIMASGVIGKKMKMDPNIFVSADAGVSWDQVLHGEYLYTFADHGGILVAAKQYEVTDSIFYSVDEGTSWSTKKIVDKNIRIYGVLTEPGEATTVFSVFGSKPEHHSWLILQVNMSSELHNRTCPDDSYKWWSFSLRNDTKTCLLGRHTLYKRRIKEAYCINGEQYVRENRTENCPCTRLDYECDFGFIQRNFSYDCIQSPYTNASRIHRRPSPCPPGTYYPYTRGYRKVAGDTCSGGQEHRYNPLQYSCPIAEKPEFVIYSSRTRISRINLDNNQEEDLVTRGLETVTAVEFDYKTDCVFWADIQLDRISKLCLSGNRTNINSIVTEGLQTVESLAFDWTADTIYWVDSEAKGIYVANTDGHFRRTLFNGSSIFDRPRGLALDPHHGYLYWTDWSVTNPHIARAWMDGTHTSIQTVVNSSYVRWPNGLAIDLPSERLYWTDAGLHKIMSSRLDGKDIRTLVQGIYSVPHPYAIGVYKAYASHSTEDRFGNGSLWDPFPMRSLCYDQHMAMNNIYWTDWSKGAVMTASKTGVGVESVRNQANIVDMKVISHTSQNGKSACTTNTCTQLCLPRPPPADHMSNHNRTCKCGDKFMHSLLSTGDEQCKCEDGQRVVAGHCQDVTTNSSSCAADKYKCNNSRCIPATWRCDHDNDCGDHSDELDCPFVTCSSTSFTCANNRCIPERWKCDFDNDCGDQSDERNCRYPGCNTTSEFQCDNHRCISLNWKCDLDNDCHDGSDERNCQNDTAPPCQSWEHTCGNGECISHDRLCDGRFDCTDRTDEHNCNSSITCSQWRYPCADGSQCIFNTWICDGEKDCHDGSDEVNCTSTTPIWTTPQPQSCHMWQFACDNGICVWHASRCDGYNDCGDNSDESDCGLIYSSTTSSPSPRTCASNQWTCESYGQCIDSTRKCDGHSDCWDGSDEANCEISCGSDHFRCYLASDRQPHCIWDSWVCDGADDCSGGEDEVNCRNSTCGSSDFHCLYSDGCIPMSQVCNGIKECDDETDEASCYSTGFPVSTPSPMTCGEHSYRCSHEGRCILWFYVCNGVNDCMDEDDEKLPQCQDKREVHGVSGTVTSDQINLVWDSPHGNSSAYSYIVSVLPEKKSSAWKNHTVSGRSYTVQHLTANTTYLVGVYVKNGSHVYPHSYALHFTTAIAPPDKPKHFKVQLRKGDALEVVVQWEAPQRHPEHIDEYHVYYNDTVSNSEPGLIQVMSQANKKTYSTILTTTQLRKHHHYDIWVRAVSGDVDSPATVKTPITFTNGKWGQISTPTVRVTKINTIVVSWKKVASATKYKAVMRYSVSGDGEELEAVNQTVKNISIFSNICPGHTYSFQVTPIFKSGPGTPSKSKQIKVPGTIVNAPQNFNITKSGATTATINFSGPEKKKSHFIYYVSHYDLALEEFLKQAKKVKALSTDTKAIPGLMACERYFFRVGAAPEGCPLSEPVSIETDGDLKAQPKNVNFSGLSYKNGISVNVTWEAPCDYEIAQVSYVIEKVTKSWRGKTLAKEVLSTQKTKNITNWHELVNLKLDVVYVIRIRTSVEGSRFSSPIQIPIRTYAAPEILEAVHQGRGLVYLSWRLPKYDKAAKDKSVVVYRVRVTRNNDTAYKTINMTKQTSMSFDLKLGYIYTFSISFKRGNMSFGPASEVQLPVFNITLEPQPSTGSLLSTTNLVAILVPIGVIVIVLASVLTIYIIRHRRLQRSFLAFANSHYDPRSGTTTFSAADSLGDDDDTPLIQGFSDDVPLVIA